ncbi:hypothetical protein HWV62_42568 [Athelia sp. TMB]|nr:hypothetical protein HWV62_42568 [Athelia sp. TMB]
MARLGHTAGDTLIYFVDELLQSSKSRSAEWMMGHTQVLWDLLLLEFLGDLWNGGWANTFRLLKECMGPLQKQSSPNEITAMKDAVKDFFSRSQLLLAPLLPPPQLTSSNWPPKDQTEKFGALLAFGVPAIEVQFHTALELAKPSSRFGLLLVGNSKAP